MKSSYIKYYILVIAMLVGFIITLQIKSNIAFQGVVTIQNLLDMQKEIENITIENQQLINATNDLSEKLLGYKGEIKSTGNISETMKNNLADNRDYADYEKVEGTGIIITLNDSLEEVTEDDNLNWYVIHDIDILEVINELKAAGAEAISINDERVTATTNIRCGGPTINIDGKRHAVPFVIKAIGEAQALESFILAENSYIDLMEYSGIRVDVQTVEHLIIKGYDGKYKLDYQKKAKGGETK